MTKEKNNAENVQQLLQQKTLTDKLSEAVSFGGLKGLAKGIVAGATVGGAVLGASYSLDALEGIVYVGAGVSALATVVAVFFYESQKEQAKYFKERLQQAERYGEFRNYAVEKKN